MCICVRCFSGFDDQPKKRGLCGREALEQHKSFCGAHKPVRPVMSEAGTTLRFDAWRKTQRHPFAIYAEVILEKTSEKRGANTELSQSHLPMSYGYLVKASDDVPPELLEQYDIPRGPVVFRDGDAAKKFVRDVTEIGKQLCELLQTNALIAVTDEERRAHAAKSVCDLCKSSFCESNPKVADIRSN